MLNMGKASPMIARKHLRYRDFRARQILTRAGNIFLKSSCPCDERRPLIPDVFFAKYSGKASDMGEKNWWQRL
jgi:hypothetical protein